MPPSSSGLGHSPFKAGTGIRFPLGAFFLYAWELAERASERMPEEMKREFYVLIEQDEDGFFVGKVPQLRGCYAQGRTMDELLQNIREVIELCLEEQTLPAER